MGRPRTFLAVGRELAALEHGRAAHLLRGASRDSLQPSNYINISQGSTHQEDEDPRLEQEAPECVPVSDVPHLLASCLNFSLSFAEKSSQQSSSFLQTDELFPLPPLPDVEWPEGVPEGLLLATTRERGQDGAP